MSLGFGIFLLAVGAIITFALPGIDVIPGVNWQLIGYIIMGAGALVTIFGIIQLARSGRSTTVSRTAVDPESGTQVRRTEHRDDLI